MHRTILQTKIGPEMGPILRKLPLISSLHFTKAYTTDYGLQKNWKSINRYKKKSGLYIIRKDEQIIRIGVAAFCLTKAIQRFFKTAVFKHGAEGDFKVAVLLAPKKRIPRLYEELYRETKKIPINDTYQKLEPFLGHAVPLPLGVLDFKPPFTALKRRTFSADYNGRGGVYLIKENGIIVYVGMSTNWLHGVMYHHFHPYGVDRQGRHHRVEFSERLSTHTYEVALIEIPSIGKTYAELEKEARALESRFIREIDPPLNTKGRISKDEELVPQLEFVALLPEEDGAIFLAEPGVAGELPF